MNVGIIGAFSAILMLSASACIEDGPVLYDIRTDSSGDGAAGGAGGQGGSGAAGAPQGMKLLCEAAGENEPCYCPAQSSCHCKAPPPPKPPPTPAPECQVDCPEGECNVTCEGHCNLWCTTGCSFECPPGASCFIKCAQGCDDKQSS